MTILKLYWKYIATLILGIALGAYVTYVYFPRIVTKECTKIETQVVTQVETKEVTSVGYVPKTSKADADVEVTRAPNVVTVSVNGTVTELPVVQGETQKFEEGKVVLEQTGSVKVDVTAQVKQQVTDGINDAFKAEQKKPKIRVGAEGAVDDKGSVDGNLRISRQSQKYDVDLRINKNRQVISGTLWF